MASPTAFDLESYHPVPLPHNSLHDPKLLPVQPSSRILLSPRIVREATRSYEDPPVTCAVGVWEIGLYVLDTLLDLNVLSVFERHRDWWLWCLNASIILLAPLLSCLLRPPGAPITRNIVAEARRSVFRGEFTGAFLDAKAMEAIVQGGGSAMLQLYALAVARDEDWTSAEALAVVVSVASSLRRCIAGRMLLVIFMAEASDRPFAARAYKSMPGYGSTVALVASEIIFRGATCAIFASIFGLLPVAASLLLVDGMLILPHTFQSERCLLILLAAILGWRGDCVFGLQGGRGGCAWFAGTLTRAAATVVWMLYAHAFTFADKYLAFLGSGDQPPAAMCRASVVVAGFISALVLFALVAYLATNTAKLNERDGEALRCWTNLYVHLQRSFSEAEDAHMVHVYTNVMSEELSEFEPAASQLALSSMRGEGDG